MDGDDFIRLDKLFEFVVAALLQTHGYKAGVPSKRLKGLKADHQIDCLGDLSVAFLFPLRLICEAKLYGETNLVDLPILRAFESTVRDLGMSLPPTFRPPVGINDSRASCLYHGALFTTADLTSDAKRYANQSGISVIVLPSVVGQQRVSEWMERLRQKIRYLDDGGECPGHCVGDTKRLAALHKCVRSGYSQTNAEERSRMLKVIATILARCPHFDTFWSDLARLRLAALGSQLIVLNISDGDRDRLAALLLDRLGHPGSIGPFPGAVFLGERYPDTEHTSRVDIDIGLNRDQSVSASIYLDDRDLKAVQARRAQLVYPVRPGLAFLGRL